MAIISGFERRILERGREEGREEGRMEGHMAGYEDGQMKVLLMMLQTRFGELPQWVLDRVSNAKSVQIQDWCNAILAKDSLEDILAS